MRIVLVAGSLVVLAGLALGASLTPMANARGLPVSAPGIGVPVAQVPALGQPAQAAHAKQSVPALSILKGVGEARDPGPPSVAAPVFPTPPPAPSRNDIAPMAQPVQGQCVIKPRADHRSTPIAVLCPPLPARSGGGD